MDIDVGLEMDCAYIIDDAEHGVTLDHHCSADVPTDLAL